MLKKILQYTAMAIAHEQISKVSSIIATCFGYWIYGQHLILSVAHGDHFVTPPAAQEYKIPLQLNPFYLEKKSGTSCGFTVLTLW